MKTSIRNVGVITALLLVSMSTQADVLRAALPGDTVTYNDITETLSDVSSGAGSFIGTYGNPGINGDQMVFSAVDLTSTSFDGGFMRGDAQLNFFAQAHDGFSIDEVQIGEKGDGSLNELVAPAGYGTATTRTEASATLIIDILEVDGNPYYGDEGDAGSTSATFASFSLPVDLGTYTWSGSLSIDVKAILGDYEYALGATKIGVTLDNFLYSYSETDTLAVIKKKGADALAITAVAVPEPASLVLLIGTTSGLAFFRRRFIG